MLNRYRTELGVEALPSELEATAQATIRQLQQDTATLASRRRSSPADRWRSTSPCAICRDTSFRPAIPSRRAWLHVTVRDAQGRVVFESGAIDDSGRDSRQRQRRRCAAGFEPHYEEITRADQVQIYEPILGDRAGAPTTGLLTAVRYLKDNRLLPRGFDKATADAEIGVYGEARPGRRLRRRRRRDALPDCRDRRRARYRRSTRSSATSRSAIAGPTISIATRRPSRRGSFRTTMAIVPPGHRLGVGIAGDRSIRARSSAH